MSEAADTNQRTRFERGYVAAFAIGAALLCVLPNIIGYFTAPPGSTYQGFQWASDDHYVYAAWMRQAMEGRLLMDNRFAVDPQPGLTIHVYFFILGLLAKITGIPFAMAISKMAFSALFIVLAHKLIQRVTSDTYVTKLALAVVTLGGGIGFLVWENFGVELERPGPFASILASLGVPGTPNDVWQPEAFVFPSMLTNGLFMVSLCLILGAFLCFLNARESWRPVLPGALCLAALMNIHSYDVLLVALVMVAFLAMQTARRAVTMQWVVRAIVIALGAIPPALWFMHVLKNDPVFQARAATPTPSPSFKVLFFGYVLLMAAAAMALANPKIRQDKKKLGGIGLVALLVVGMYLAPISGAGMWAAAFIVAVAACVFLASESVASNLVIAWAFIGLVAPYFPSDFQRKLTMGLSVPWAILAALGLAFVIHDKERSKRNLATVLTILVLGGTSLRWFFREIELSRLDVSGTTYHSVYLSRDVQAIVKYLNEHGSASNRTVVIAMPGVQNKPQDSEVKDTFLSPLVPDLNPVLSGLTGVYAYAGHWSETPDYGRRRDESTRVFLQETPEGLRREILDKVKPNYLIAPDPSAFPGIADLSALGEVVAGGNQFKLIKLR